MLQHLVDLRVLVGSDTEFGDMQYRVDSKAMPCNKNNNTKTATTKQIKAVQWVDTYDLLEGSNVPTGFLQLGRVQERRMRSACKLTLMMHLAAEGWEANGAADVLVPGDALRYRQNVSKSRWYFVALAESTQIFNRMPIADDQLPFISHTMNEPYYKAMRVCVDCSVP